MNKNEAYKLVQDTFTQPFSEERFNRFIGNLLPGIEAASTGVVSNAQLPQGFRDQVNHYKRMGTYHDADGFVLDVVVVKLLRQTSLDRARIAQRNLMAHYLQSRSKDAVLVAYISDDLTDWRFSYVKLAYNTEKNDKGKVIITQEFTPARRYSFLVGEQEPSHTAQKQLGDLLTNPDNLKIDQIEQAFTINTVTNEFFADYKDLFLHIKENLDEIIDTNQQVKAEFQRCEIDTANFAKKLLGQIVFLYFLQKKGWLGVAYEADWGSGDKQFLSNLFKKNKDKNFFDEVLEPFFYLALAIERSGDKYEPLKCKIPFLNGGLFEPLHNYKWQNIHINLKNEVFAEIFRVFNQYNFTVREDEPLEKEVAVDPEMLGKVFENLLEVTDRKSKGAFYTPREIVHYICQESLINYLDSTLNSETVIVLKEDIEKFIYNGQAALENDLAKEAGRKSGKYGIPESIKQFAEQMDVALANVKICDPAIGSGAFPVGMMTEIVRARGILTEWVAYTKNRDPYNFKWHCIENSIYGVDIEPSAVEIAKLRLWLSLVVDEESYDRIRPLPNLDYRIVCGNSLQFVEKNLFNYTLFPELEKKKIQYFGTTSAKNKEVLKIEIENLIDQLTNGKNDFDFEIYFSEIFSQNKGFDIVVGNPPYVRQESLGKEKKLFQKNYQVYSGTSDLYVYFIEKGISLLSLGGVFCYIVSNKWLRANYGKPLRAWLKDKCIEEIIDFGDLPVFENATTYPCIIRVTNQTAHYKPWVTNVKTLDFQSLTEYVKENGETLDQTKLTNDGWILVSRKIQNLFDKLSQKSIPLEKYVDGKIYRGILTGLNEAFVIDKSTRDRLISKNQKNEELIRTFLIGKDIQRYQITLENRYIILIPKGWTKQQSNYTTDGWNWFQKNYSSIAEYLAKYATKATKRFDQGDYWWELRACDYYDTFEKPKITWGNLAVTPKFYFDTEKFYINAPSVIIPKDDLYLLGVLNSKISFFIISNIAAGRQGGYFEYKPVYVSQIPIRIIDINDPTDNVFHEQIVNLVQNMLDMHKQLQQPLFPQEKKHLQQQIHWTDSEIDKLVYELYGLTDEEISIIEGN